jgi:hypothetical protein
MRSYAPNTISAWSHAMTPLSRAALCSACKKELGLGALALTKPAEDDPGEIWLSPVKFEGVRTLDRKPRVFKTDRIFIEEKRGTAACGGGVD